MELSEAKALLNGCVRSEDRDHAFGDVAVFWEKDGVEVAEGHFGQDAEIWFSSKDGDTIGSFGGLKARELRNCGTIGKISRNDETGPDTFVEGKTEYRLTREAVRQSLIGD